MMVEKGYPFLNSEEFSALSDSEREEYYQSLAAQKEEAYTCEQKQMLSDAYFALGEYADALKIAESLSSEATEQRAADESYNIRKFRMGIIVISAICVAIAAAAAVITVISMG